MAIITVLCSPPRLRLVYQIILYLSPVQLTQKLGSRHESFTSGAIVRVPNFNSRSTPREFSSLLLHRYRRSRCANAAYASQSMNPNSTPPPWDAVPARLFPTGYSEAYRSYEATKHAWQQTAYKHTGIGPGLINEKVELLVQVLHEVPGKSQGKLVGVSEIVLLIFISTHPHRTRTSVRE